MKNDIDYKKEYEKLSEKYEKLERKYKALRASLPIYGRWSEEEENMLRDIYADKSSSESEKREAALTGLRRTWEQIRPKISAMDLR